MVHTYSLFNEEKAIHFRINEAGTTTRESGDQHGIVPYSTQEMEFADANAAKTWMIKNQLGRRNVNAFVKVELVLPLRDSLLEEGRKNHGRLRKQEKTFPNLGKFSGKVNTEKQLAELAGIAHGSFYMAKWLVENATESTKKALRVSLEWVRE